MKPKNMALVLGLCLLGIGTAGAQRPNPSLGAWTPMPALSKIPTTDGRITKIVWEAAGPNVKEIAVGTDASGKPVRTEGTGKFDGHDYPGSRRATGAGGPRPSGVGAPPPGVTAGGGAIRAR